MNANTIPYNKLGLGSLKETIEKFEKDGNEIFFVFSINPEKQTMNMTSNTTDDLLRINMFNACKKVARDYE